MHRRSQKILLLTLATVTVAAGLAALLEVPAHAQRVMPPGARLPVRPRPILNGGPVYVPPPRVTPRPVEPSSMGLPAMPAPPMIPQGSETPGEPGEDQFNKCLKVPPGKKVLSTLKPDSDLSDLVQWVESFTCKRFVYSSMVRSAKVTVWMPDEVTPAEAYRIFLSALEAMGLTVVPAGPVLKIVETQWARGEAPPIFRSGEAAPATDAYVTRLFRLQHAPAEQLVPVLNTMKSKDGLITPYAPTNAVIVTDTGANVDAMADMIRELDVASMGDHIFMIHLKNASSDKVKATLDEIFAKLQKPGMPGQGVVPPPQPMQPQQATGGQGGAGTEFVSSEIHVTNIVSDPRTNSIIVVATEQSYLEVLALVQKLDVPIAGNDDMLHVYTLENGDATLIAQTLAGITSGAGARPMPTPGGRPGIEETAFEGPVRVTADKATNSLIVVADLKDYLALEDVIRQLDQPRRQVFVEAAILEVSLDRDRKLGLSFHGGDTSNLTSGGPSLFFGASESSSLSSFTINPSALVGLAAGLLGPPIPNAGTVLGLPPGTSIPSFGIMLQAIQTNNDVNVLSTPTILTTDNEESEISVGQNVPYLGMQYPSFGATGATGQTGSTGLPFGGFGFGTPVQRMDVALKMGITPHINSGDYVRLKVDIEISDIFATNFNNLGPATNKRTAKTTIVVKDQQTAVLGGLMSDKTTESETKVPLLGDIPILGWLFRYTEKQAQKTDLVIFLTPYIIRDPSDLRRIFERKIAERREFLERNTAFRSTLDFEAHVDYRRKRGLIDEIDAEARDVEQEQQEYEEVRRPRGLAVGEGEITPSEAVTQGAATQPAGAPEAPASVPAHVQPPASQPSP